MKHMYRRIVFALFIATLPLAAVAQQVFTLRDVDVFAGPSSEYPPVAQLPPGTSVQLAGCLSDWSWCDVFFANDRGWVYAGDLGYSYQGDRVVIIEYGPRLRLPVVTFSLQTYWSAHYSARPWFRERDVWVNRVHVEANRGGPPPHGRQAQGRPEGGGGQAAQPAQPRAAQPAQPQAAQPQGGEARQPEERAARQPQRPQPEAGQAPQGERREQRARPTDENRAPQGMREQQQPMQAPAGDAQRAGRQPEGMQQQAPQADQRARGRQPEASQAHEADKEKRSEGKRAPDRERPKEEGQ